MNTVETSTIQEVADITGLSYQTVRNKWRRGEIEGYQRVKNAPIQLFNESWQKAFLLEPEEVFEPVKVEYDVSDQVSLEEVSDPEKQNHAGKKHGWKRIETRVDPDCAAWIEESMEKMGITRNCDFLDTVLGLVRSLEPLLKYMNILMGNNEMK